MYNERGEVQTTCSRRKERCSHQLQPQLFQAMSTIGTLMERKTVPAVKMTLTLSTVENARVCTCLKALNHIWP